MKPRSSDAFRLAAAFLFTLALAGCGRPEVTACEQFIKAQLVSPASYQRAMVRTVDETVSAEDYYKAAGRQIGSFDPIAQKHIRGDNYAVRTVVIDYDVSNDFGEVERAKNMCQFRLNGDGPVIPNMDYAIATNETRRAAVRLVGPPIIKPDAPCCLS